MELELEPTGSAEFFCACCADTTFRVWGFVHEQDRTRCAYFVQWAASRGSHSPHITLGYGGWGEGTSAADRAMINAELRGSNVEFVDHSAPGFGDHSDVLGFPLLASIVTSDPQAPEVRETIEFILASDERLCALSRQSTPT